MYCSRSTFRHLALFALIMPFGAIAQTLSVTLDSPEHNGYNISCFGMKDGVIDATITGGTPPYSVFWSNEATTEDLTGLPAGLYIISVSDADANKADGRLTLTEPENLKLSAEPYKYASGYNISCNECFNGSIDVTVFQGVSPYTYLWADGATTQDRSGLGAFSYSVMATDANGCTVVSEKLNLTQPERNDWRMGGNAGTDPSTQYIGTSDVQDVVFKSNGEERMRILSGGDVRMNTLATEEPYGLLVADEDGTIKRLVEGDIPLYSEGCPGHAYPWTRCGNTISPGEYIGTNNARPFLIKTNAALRMTVATDGKVAIGASQPADQFEVHTALDHGGITLVNSRTDANSYSGLRFKKNSQLRWSLGTDMDANGTQNFFLRDEVAGSARLQVDAGGRVGIGAVEFGNSSLYKLYVEGGIVCRDVKVTIQDFPDYVFAQNYRLRSIDELRAFLKAQGHLPGIPSAAEVEQDHGVEVGALQTKMLRVIEEQSLYILQLEERLARLEKAANEEATQH